MYHSSDFEGWWESNGLWYEKNGITMDEFKKFKFKDKLNKGDVVLVLGKSNPLIGDVIIFNANYKYPLIHRLVTWKPLGTKGDHNFNQLRDERSIKQGQVLGKAVARVPAVGWLKLIFFEWTKPKEQRGFCK